MPILHIYCQPDLPAIFKWQAIAFMRTEWSDIFRDDNLYMSETYPPDAQPVHFVLAEGDTLISYAAILFCDPKLEPFYAAQRWQATCSPTRLGRPDRYEVYHPTRMMLFGSEKGQSGKRDFESQPIYIDLPW